MKVYFLILFLCLGSGCSLIPKSVEFFQKKVHAVPDKSFKNKETEKQAALYVNDKVNQARDEAIKLGVTNSVITPLTDAKIVIEPLVGSLGPPASRWLGNSTNLAAKLIKNESGLDKKVDDYKEDTKKLEGKKVEGSGLFQIPYFVWLGVVFVFLFVVYVVGRSAIQALMISSGAGIPVSMGLKTITGIAGKTAKTAFSQIVHGVELTKDYIKGSDKDTFTKEEILKIIRDEQQKAQNADVQKIVKELTHS
ncbi:MAG: hypothetical protein Q8Q91_00435 [Candidatus Daviesbacteria bacterium]|nr:hypothetical protein [Candidatus Daviesbacteria bacterium]